MQIPSVSNLDLCALSRWIVQYDQLDSAVCPLGHVLSPAGWVVSLFWSSFWMVLLSKMSSTLESDKKSCCANESLFSHSYTLHTQIKLETCTWKFSREKSIKWFFWKKQVLHILPLHSPIWILFVTLVNKCLTYSVVPSVEVTLNYQTNWIRPASNDDSN